MQFQFESESFGYGLVGNVIVAAQVSRFTDIW